MLCVVIWLLCWTSVAAWATDSLGTESLSAGRVAGQVQISQYWGIL